ncbi:FUSC family protein [Planosporangium sp. 12N6]|uniref:FUSC family protein n=1 Tax=Planosporangium spinosum TaxID=3402278 RepID=UPI003CF36078
MRDRPAAYRLAALVVGLTLAAMQELGGNPTGAGVKPRRPRVHIDTGELRRLVGAGSTVLSKVAAGAWPLLHQAAAATVAWVIARHLVQHHQPFFAPVAAVVALNASLGERGLNTLRLLLGVVVGIVTGELALGVLRGGYGTLAVASFTAMAVARALGGARIVIAQAAAGAILTVAVANGEAGTQRLEDALIGAGVALVFSQLLFPPEPVALVRRAEAAALAEMAVGVELTARALDGDGDLAAQAMSRLRELRDQLSELGRTRRASCRVVRHSVAWRSRTAPVVRENENAGHLDLLGDSCLMLTRTVMAISPRERRRLVPSVRELVGALTALAKKPGDRATRQHAADRALDAARRLADIDTPADSALAAAIMAVRMVAADIMVFAGVDPGRAGDASRVGTGRLNVPTPPSTPRTPFDAGRWRPAG